MSSQFRYCQGGVPQNLSKWGIRTTNPDKLFPLQTDTTCGQDCAPFYLSKWGWGQQIPDRTPSQTNHKFQPGNWQAKWPIITPNTKQNQLGSNEWYKSFFFLKLIAGKSESDEFLIGNEVNFVADLTQNMHSIKKEHKK